MVVVVLSSLQFFLQVVQRDEFMHIKEFITQSTVERFDEPIIRRLAWACVVEFDAMKKSCLKLPSSASQRHSKKQKSPQLRGLSGFLCLQVPDRARRRIIPTRSSLAPEEPHECWVCDV